LNGALRRDESAVSAAVATVLLFGGVLSIIGLMMVSMMPVIEEMEGSVERHDMSSQMTLLAAQTHELSERGMPGDATTAELIPVDGTLAWDSLRGGMWYSATWHEGHELRARGALDFDDQVQIRHGETRIEAVCITDLRQGVERPYRYTLDAGLDAAMVTVLPGLTMPLGPVELTLEYNGDVVEERQLRVDELATFLLSESGDLVLTSTHELTVLALRGEAGASLLIPSDHEPVDDRGHAWSIPMPAGTHRLEVLSDVANQIQTTVDGTTQVEYALPTNEIHTGVTHTVEMNLTGSRVVQLTTSAPSRVLFINNASADIGVTPWPSVTGQYIGSTFLPPTEPGTLRLTNPSEEVVTATWLGSGISVQPGEAEHVAWPPQQVEGAAILDADGSLMMTWAAASDVDAWSAVSGQHVVAAHDTGSLSGADFPFMVDVGHSEDLRIELAGYVSTWNITGPNNASGTFLESQRSTTFDLVGGNSTLSVVDDHPLRVTRFTGQHGMHPLLHDGAERCTAIGTQASGWITTELPWEPMGGRGAVDVERAWQQGTHPSSVEMEVIGGAESESHAVIGTVWAFHLSRLAYDFSSSIDGMEVAFSGGAVVTNHPEFKPYVIVPPSDRGGPGPRFAATVPSFHPADGSLSGGGAVTLDIELVNRRSLASTPAYEIRRGWSEPYGTAIADYAGAGLDASEDWAVYPGRLDLLTDHVGWVPDPSYGTAEAVWHTNGQVIEFTLQLSMLDVTARGALA